MVAEVPEVQDGAAGEAAARPAGDEGRQHRIGGLRQMVAPAGRQRARYEQSPGWSAEAVLTILVVIKATP